MADLVLSALERLGRGFKIPGELLGDGDGEVVDLGVELDADRVVDGVGIENTEDPPLGSRFEQRYL